MLQERMIGTPPAEENEATEAINARLVAWFKALADGRRLSIFRTLMEGVQCNCEIAERLGLSLSLVSYHLRILAEVGLVESEQDAEDGRWLYYSIKREVLERLQREAGSLLDTKQIQPRQPCCGPRGCKSG